MTHALIALLAVLGLSALPAASASTLTAPAPPPAVTDDGEFIDEAELAEDPSEFDAEAVGETDVAGNEDLGDFCDVAGDQGVADDATDEADVTDGTDVTDETEDFRRRDVTNGENVLDPLALVDDGSADEGDLADDSSDEDLADDACAVIENGVIADEVGTTDVTNLRKKGVVTAEVYASGPGRLDSTLTNGATGRSAAIAGVRVLGGSHQKVAKAGKVTIRIKLTKQGRKVLRKAKRTLRLTLGTKLALTSGKTVKRTKTLTVKPAKKQPGKGRKPKKH
jgi:hypothetical protein